MRGLLVVLAPLVLAPVASAEFGPAQPLGNTEARLIHYAAHDGVRRAAWLLTPVDLGDASVPLVTSPHGRGVGADENALLWGDLPGEGGFAVIVRSGHRHAPPLLRFRGAEERPHTATP